MVKAKLGHTVHMDIQKFKDESEDYVAHMWRRVALSSREPLEQMSSYQLAIEALNSPSNEWQKVEYLLEFGQWLYVNDFPLQDAIDQIEWAADILLNMTSQNSQTTIAPAEGKAKGSSMFLDGKKVPAKAAATKVAKGRRTPPKKGGSLKESKESLAASHSRKSVSIGDKLTDVKSTSSESENEINPADYIPIAKEADIGVLPVDTSLTVTSVVDARQLDMLVRVHVVLAQVVGSASQCYRDICLTAYGYLMQLWKVCLSTSGPVLKELATNQPDSLPSGKKSTQPKSKNTKEPAKDKAKRKGALDTMPVTTEDWAHYDAPDELLEAFKQEAMKKTGINSETIEKPMLSLHTLNTLMTMLSGVGYTHLMLPILAFQDVLSRSLLKSNALHVLTHIRAIEVCQQLDLKSGCNYHEKLIGGQMQISEDERAMSREEIAILKEKKVQVTREEMRLKESLARLAEQTSEKDQRKLRTRPTDGDKKEDVMESHLGKVLGAVTFRDVWTDTAEVLIRLGFYQNARDLLAEANIAAQEFDDKPLQGRILYLLAKLSFEEAQFIQAVNLCKAAQEMFEGDEMYWFDTTKLMIDATLEDYENRYSSRLARTIVVHALNEFLSVHELRPNRLSITGYILGILEGKLASIQATVLMKKNINAPQIMKGVLSACERFENATDRLIKLGYKREAVPFMKEYAGILRYLARNSIENEIKHTYYLQSLLVLREGLSLAEEVFQDVQTLCSLSNNRNMSFPTQREFADILIETGDLLLEILQLHDKERRMKQFADQRKGSIVKMVEDFICQTPVYTHMEKEWVEIAHTCGEEALSKLLTAHSLAGNIQRLKARALCSMGWCFKLLSLQKGPDAPPHWLVHEMEMLKTNFEAESVEADETDEKSEPPDKEEKAFRKYSPLIKQMKDMHQDSKYYLIQATECLVQCLSLSLYHKFTDLAGRVSLELVDCFGQFDPATASSFLALHQSCETSRHLEKILHTSQPDPTTSKLAALLRQRYNLQLHDISTNLSNSPLMASIQAALQADWQCWKRLEVMPNHIDLLREFPPNFNFVILQHSPDKNFLYGSLLDKPRPGGDKMGEKRSQKQASTVPSRARVFGMETSARLLNELVSKFQQHKQSVQQLLLKQEYQRTQAALRQKMLQNLDDNMKQQEAKLFLEEEDRDEENRLQEEFRELVAAMELYLKPIMEPIEAALSSNPPVTVKDPPPSQECVILLADPDLMQMPLEALECLSAELIAAFSRDFSLQLFYHRYHVDQPVEDPAGEKKKKPKGGDQLVTSRIPGAREAKQKQAKIIPLDRPLKPGQISMNTMNVKYILDTNLDCAETEENKPIEQFQKVLDEYEQQFTPRWLGISGEDHTPSVGEWEVYMIESSGFIFYGMEHLLSYIPPSKISALNIPDCTMLYLLDLAQTSKSFLGQSKIDVLKSHSDLALEKPLETAMLTSLTGVKCIMMNQWYCTLAENKDRLHLTMKDLLEKGKMTGETVRLLCSPQRRKAEEEASIAAEEEASQNKASVDSDSRKGDRRRGGSPESPRSPRKDPGGKKDQGGKKGRSQGSGSSRVSSRASSRSGHKEGVQHDEEGDVDPDKDQEEPKEEERMFIQRSWFNMVCYGLPSIVFTH
ncbi:cilia- and flagella-associated protein 46-like isoform X2 [Gigantopelta aegis]|uniref:cilia- and flagella-associated protein 46-like isoform X2 n=1 Tax=Gigantopelta aegis TaxID=1735272 RepID=UPI001B887A25|nr:cilia- and flagella-associated protein 46-like isoform X2 [Gigantopelta aegis]